MWLLMHGRSLTPENIVRTNQIFSEGRIFRAPCPRLTERENPEGHAWEVRCKRNAADGCYGADHLEAATFVQRPNRLDLDQKIKINSKKISEV